MQIRKLSNLRRYWNRNYTIADDALIISSGGPYGSLISRNTADASSLFGFFGDRTLAETIIRKWPSEMRKVIYDRPGDSLYYSSEIPPREEDDTLFDPTTRVAPSA